MAVVSIPEFNINGRIGTETVEQVIDKVKSDKEKQTSPSANNLRCASRPTAQCEQAGGDETKTMIFASSGFAVKSSQWNWYGRGKVADRLTMALGMMSPKPVTTQVLNINGIGEASHMDYSQLCVAIAACIDGGPVTQEHLITF